MIKCQLIVYDQVPACCCAPPLKSPQSGNGSDFDEHFDKVIVDESFGPVVLALEARLRHLKQIFEEQTELRNQIDTHGHAADPSLHMARLVALLTAESQAQISKVQEIIWAQRTLSAF